MTRIAIVIAAGALLSAAPAWGQAHSHDHAAGEKQEMKCAMHAEGHGAGGEHAAHGTDPLHRSMPKMILQHADGLKLAPAQVARLEELQAAHKAECEKRMAQVKAAEEAAAAALALPAPDARGFEAKLREAAGLKVDCKVDMFRTGQAAQAVLTPEQRTHLGHMGEAGHGGHAGHSGHTGH